MSPLAARLSSNVRRKGKEMFVRHPLNDGRALLVESLGRPIVYLDNWALNDIALDASHREIR